MYIYIYEVEIFFFRISTKRAPFFTFFTFFECFTIIKLFIVTVHIHYYSEYQQPILTNSLKYSKADNNFPQWRKWRKRKSSKKLSTSYHEGQNLILFPRNHQTNRSCNISGGPSNSDYFRKKVKKKFQILKRYRDFLPSNPSVLHCVRPRSNT